MSEEFHAVCSNSRGPMRTRLRLRSRRAARVTMMQAADHRHADNRAKRGRREFPLIGSTSDFVNAYEYDRLNRMTAIRQYGLAN